MNKFAYVAVNKRGETLRGEMEAKNREEVASILTDSGLSPVKIFEKFDVFGILTPAITNQKVPTKEKVIFLREFATMVSAGLPLDDALDVSMAQTSHKGFKNILANITKEVRSGSSLAAAFSKFPKVFSNIEISLIKAGEVSGKMDIILIRLADDVEKQSILTGKVKGALTYPIFILVIAGLVISVITVKLVPAMQSLYSGFGSTDLPLPTQMLIGLSAILTNYYLVVAIAAVILFAAYYYYQSTPDGKRVIDSLLLKLPVVGDLVAKYQVVLFIKTYAMLVASGIPVINSLNLVGDSLSNRLYAKAIKETSHEVERGVSLASALSKYEYIPSILWRSIAVGEETGKTEDILSRIGQYFEEQVNDRVNNLTRLLEPILLVVLGGIVGFIAVAIYLPIYNFSSIIH